MNWVDWVFLVVLLASVLAGIHKGLIRTVFSLAGVVVGFVAASREGGGVALVCQNWMSREAAQVCGFVIVFVGVVVVFALAAWLLRKILQGLSLSWLDRLLGAGIGFVRAALILGVVALVMESAGPLGATKQSITYPYALEAGRLLLNVVPESTLERLDWKVIRDRVNQVRENLPQLENAPEI
jgi:membrane protein required for colicin V production